MNKHLLFLCKSLLLGTLLVSAMHVNAQDITLDWVKDISAGPVDIAIDEAGNAYIIGTFVGTVDFDPGSGVSELVAPVKDIYILKLDITGSFIWVKQIGKDSSGSQQRPLAHSIDVDAQGNVLIAGHFHNTLDFDPGADTADLTSNGSHDCFILKLDASGNYRWAVGFGGNSRDAVTNLTTDDEGNVFSTGYFMGTADFDPGSGSLNLNAPLDDVFVLKLDSTGSFQWASQLFATLGRSNAIALDNSGNPHVAGRFTAPTGQGISANEVVSVWKLDTNGALLWTYYTDPDNWAADDATDIAFDEEGNGAYVTGFFKVNIDLDRGPGVDSFWVAPPFDAYTNFLPYIFVLKLDTAGNYDWFKAIEVEQFIQGRSLNEHPHFVVDASGNIIVASKFTGTADFDPGQGIDTLTSSGYIAPPLPEDPSYQFSYDLSLIKLDAQGNYVWAKSIGGIGNEIFKGSIVSDTHGSIWCVGGSGSNPIDFDPGPGVSDLSSAGSFVIKLNCNDTSSSIITDTADNCVSYTLNGETYTASGTYTQIIPNAAGCDSTITLHLTIPQLEPIITVDEFTLRTTLPYSSYQWLLDGVPISGATQDAYTVTENGDYTVRVTNETGCTGTSAIFTVNNVSIEDIKALSKAIRIYPNPTQDLVHIQSPLPVNIALSSIEGKLLQQISNAETISLKNLASGIYLLRVANEEGEVVKVEKLVKQNIQ